MHMVFWGIYQKLTCRLLVLGNHIAGPVPRPDEILTQLCRIVDKQSGEKVQIKILITLKTNSPQTPDKIIKHHHFPKGISHYDTI